MCSNNCVNVFDLDYVVIKLNGNDITSLSSYEAVQLFLQAKETLVVELSRKKKNNIKCTSTENSNGEEDDESAICTKVENFQICDSRNINSSALPVPKNEIILTLRTSSNFDNVDVNATTDDVELTVVSKETQTTDNFFDIKKNVDHNKDIAQKIADHFIEQQHHLFEQCLEPEIGIEEVTLVNDSIGGQMGITVCSNGFFNNTHTDGGIRSVICNDNKSSSDLILEYPDPDSDPDVCEDVFVSDIQSESIADRDGRLKRGDQILRVNGIDIKNKNHAESQIGNNKMAVTLLVSRILYPEDEDDDDDDDEDDIDSNFEYANRFLSDDYTNVVDKLDKAFLAQRQCIKPTNEIIPDIEPAGELPATNDLPISPVAQNHNQSVSQISNTTITENVAIDQTNLTLQSNSNLQSNISSAQLIVKSLPNSNSNTRRSTAVSSEITKYDYDESEHIYETIPEDSESEPLYCSPYQSSNYMTAMGSCSSGDVLEMQHQTQRVAQWLGLKSQISSRSVHTLSGGRPSLNTKQQNRIANRVYTLRSAITNTTSGSSSSGAGYSACGYINGRNDNENQNTNQNQEEVDNSSSAYNTGGSNNSASLRQNPVNLETENITTCANNRALSGSYKFTSSPSKNTLLASPINSMLMLPFGKTGSILCSTHLPQKGTLSEELQPFTSASVKAGFKLMRPKQTEEQQSHCPQFNAPNLSRYHFVSSQEVANKAVSVSKPNSILVNAESVSEEIPMVWKVKRRPDGTRYIVKRPVRNHANMSIRKNIRNNDIPTTEDDTISEVKIGRYWTKEERKRHIERARERRHHQQQQHKQQFTT